MYVLEWQTVLALTRGLFWCLFPSLQSNKGNKHQQHNESKNDDKNDDFCTSSPQFSFRWWRHNQLLMTSQWPDNCDKVTWIAISNSLDIDFIHGNIHGQSCKNTGYLWLLLTSYMPDDIIQNGWQWTDDRLWHFECCVMSSCDLFVTGLYCSW